MNSRTEFIEELFISRKQHLYIHNTKVQFLDTLAELMGCKASIGCSLPDGRRPDVLRVDTKRHILFIGEGKNTESPGCLDTQDRLREYLRWISAHVCDGDRPAILAICFEKKNDSKSWIEVMDLLCREVGIYFQRYGVEDFGPGFNVVWFISACCHYGQQSEHVSTQ